MKSLPPRRVLIVFRVRAPSHSVLLLRHPHSTPFTPSPVFGDTTTKSNGLRYYLIGTAEQSFRGRNLRGGVEDRGVGGWGVMGDLSKISNFSSEAIFTASGKTLSLRRRNLTRVACQTNYLPAAQTRVCLPPRPLGTCRRGGIKKEFFAPKFGDEGNPFDLTYARRPSLASFISAGACPTVLYKKVIAFGSKKKS